MGQGEARLQMVGGAELARTIYEIGLAANATGDLSTVLGDILDRILRETGATWVGVELVDGSGETLKHLRSVLRDGGLFPQDWQQLTTKGVVGRVVTTGESFCITDVREVDFYEEVVPGILSEAAVPLTVDEEVIGVLNVESTELAAFGPTVMALLRAVATPVALTIRNAQLFQEERRRSEQLTMLNQVSQIITSTVDLDELLARTVHAIREKLDYELVTIGLVEDQDVVLRAIASTTELEISPGHRQPLGSGLVGGVIEQCQSVLVADVRGREDHKPLLPEICCEMCCPLRVADRVIGFLDVQSREVGAFDEHDVRALQTIADHISQAIENARIIQKLDELRQDLVAMVVHDLRNPLTIIQTALDLLSLQLDTASHRVSLSEAFPIKSIRRYLLNGQSAGQEMLVLINGLLDLQKMEFGALELRCQLCSAGDLVRGVAQRTQIIAEARQIDLSIELDQAAPTFECDVELFSRVLENLLGNALKYTPEGGQVTIAAHLAQEELVPETFPGRGAVLFSVSDTGPGIPHEDRERVFEKFAVVELRRRAEKKLSTGLGLAFCRQAVRAHGGVIWIEGQEKAGSRFCVLMPLRNAGKPSTAARE